MKFKRSHLAYEYEDMPELLTEMSELFEDISSGFDIEPIVTRVTEKIEGSSGVHEAGRAIDFRDEFKGKHLYSRHQREMLLTALNNTYARSDNRRTLIWHSFNGAPYHFHLQQASVGSVYELNSKENENEKQETNSNNKRSSSDSGLCSRLRRSAVARYLSGLFGKSSGSNNGWTRTRGDAAKTYQIN